MAKRPRAETETVDSTKNDSTVVKRVKHERSPDEPGPTKAPWVLKRDDKDQITER